MLRKVMTIIVGIIITSVCGEKLEVNAINEPNIIPTIITNTGKIAFLSFTFPLN